LQQTEQGAGRDDFHVLIAARKMARVTGHKIARFRLDRAFKKSTIRLMGADGKLLGRSDVDGEARESVPSNSRRRLSLRSSSAR
jgi:hypothetical protein